MCPSFVTLAGYEGVNHSSLNEMNPWVNSFGDCGWIPNVWALKQKFTE